MFAPVYLDHNATTPLADGVLAAMLPWLEEQFGNASSRHEYGRAARRALDEARDQVAAAVGAHPSEVLFVSGGSEANNLFIKGAAACRKPGVLAHSAIEHPCIYRPAAQLQRQGWQVRKIAVDAQGAVVPEDFAEAMAGKPALTSVMLANNESGVVQDLCPLAVQAKAAGSCFHTDAVQALGKLPVNFRELNRAGVQAMTISGHKVGGPKGAAALIVDKRVELAPLVAGGGHERGLRSGTENVAALVGFGVACELARQRQAVEAIRLLALRERLDSALLAMGAQVFSLAATRLPNTVYFSLPDADGETLVGKLDRAGFAVASGAACSSANPEPSHVLLAMGVSPELARGAVRVSLGATNTLEDIDKFMECLRQTLVGLTGLTALVA